MKVVGNKKSYSKKQIIKNRIIEVGIFSILIICFVISLKYFLHSMDEGQKWLNVTLVISLISLLLGIFFGLILALIINKMDLFFQKIEFNIDIAKAGDEGEKAVYNELNKFLNDDYTVYPNYEIPGHKFDLDFLIVGPKGLVVVEVKNYSNSTFFSEQQAASISGARYTREIKKSVRIADPRTQIDTHCKVLNGYLNYLGLTNINIRKVLVFTKDHVKIEGKTRIFIVKKIYELAQYFDNLYPDDKFNPRFCHEINKKLSQ